MVGLGRFLRLFRAILTHFRRLIKPTLNLQDPTQDLQFADDFADSLFDNNHDAQSTSLIRGGFPNPKDPWSGPKPFYSCEDL